MTFAGLAALATMMLVAPLPAGQPSDTAPSLSIAVPQHIQACRPVQVVVHVDNTARPAQEVVFRLVSRGDMGSPLVESARLADPTGGWTPFDHRLEPRFLGHVSPPIWLPAGNTVDWRIELEVSGNEGTGFDLDLQVEVAVAAEPTPLAAAWPS